MNAIKQAAGALTLVVAGFAGTASAAPYTWTDVYDPSPDVELDSGESISFTHMITDAASGGFRPGIDSVWDADILIALYDDGDSQLEQARFRFDGNSSSWYEVNGSAGSPSLFGFDLNNSWLTDGLLSVRVSADDSWREDFFFARSTLTVRGDQVPVPEPASLALLGLGLAVVGVAARRRKR